VNVGENPAGYPAESVSIAYLYSITYRYLLAEWLMLNSYRSGTVKKIFLILYQECTGTGNGNKINTGTGIRLIIDKVITGTGIIFKNMFFQFLRRFYIKRYGRCKIDESFSCS
jgi:hypothetical protein